MASFIKCTQSSFSYKTMKKEVESTKQVKSKFFITKEEFSFKDVIDEILTKENHPINLDLVAYISKTEHFEKDSNYKQIIGSKKFGICFDFLKGSQGWFYDEEKDRDSQFDEISNNSHSYKQRVDI